MTLSTVTAQSQHALEGVSNAIQPGSSAMGGRLTPFSSMVDIHRSLDEVRHMREFQPPQPNWLDELLKQPLIQQLRKTLGHWLEQALKDIGHLLSQIHPSGLNHLPENIRDVFSGFIGFLVVLLSLYAFYLVLGWLLQLKETRAPKSPQGARQFEEALLINSAYHYQQAQAAAKENQFQEALRQLYMATLCLLDEQAVVPYTVTRSNLEYLHSLEVATESKPASRSELKLAFSELARRFEAARYGNQPVDISQFEASQANYNTIQAMAVAAHG